ncbi:hypothetical protein TWF730_008307 [Orbilia blumenaviensis]|uniref:Rhodopsin domain-containing protein n=1 Tax=Orbilia blumenaviensis TaxID=1796055 RepID=A0AAV9V373_9PEZI
MAPTPTATLSSDAAGRGASRHTIFLSVTFVLLGIATAFVILRLYCRYFLIRRLGLDDWLITVGIATEWALAGMNHFHIKYGTGRHISTVTIGELIPTLRYWFAYQILYPIVLLFIKLSILAFYVKISPQRWYQNTIYGVGIFVIIWTIVFVFAFIFECPNPSRAWSLDFPRGCVNLPALYYSTASINIASDLIILLLPIPVLRRLQIDKRRKWALIAIFSVGVVAVAGSIARLWSLWKYQHTVDVSYDAIFILLFSHIEINLAIMCACAPALRPLFKSFATPFSSKARKSGGKGSISSSKENGGGAAGSLNARPVVSSRVGSGNGPVSTSIARNRAKFEMTDPPKRESPEGRVVKITGGTPYYTPPLEMAVPKTRRPTDDDLELGEEEDYYRIDDVDVDDEEEDHETEGRDMIRRPPPAKFERRSVPNFQLDGSYGFSRPQSSNIRHASTMSAPVTSTTNNRSVQLSKLAGEYSVTCSSTHSLTRNSTGGTLDLEYFGFVHRPSIWRRQSVISRFSGRARSAIGFPAGDEGENNGEDRRQSELEVNIKHEIRTDYELMTEEEKERWERKRSVLDAVDSLW